MPLPMKTLQEAAIELGMPEAEIKTLVNLRKIRSIMKRGKLYFAPDELAKMKRMRKTIPDSAKSTEGVPVAPPKPVTTRPPTTPRRPPPNRRIGGP